MIALVGVFVLRTIVLTYSWYAYDHVYAGIRRAFATLPAGSILFSATEDGIPSLQDLDLRLWQPPLEHAATLAVLGHDVFVPQTWAKIGQQSISVTPRYQSIARYQTPGPLPVTTAEELASVIAQARKFGEPSMTYLLLLYPNYRNLTWPADTRIVATGTDFVLFKL